MTRNRHSSAQRAVVLPFVALAGVSLLLAACSSSSKSTTSSSTNASTTTAGPSASDAAVTVKVANVPGVGNVLVDGNGRTLYVLVSEKGGKVNCTSSGGCTNIWPPVVVPSGMGHGIAGAGAQASLLGTVMSPSGDVRLTYGGWPLYLFSSDTAPGQARGQGVNDTYGLWWVLNASGNPVTTKAASSGAAPAATTPTTAGSTPATSPPTTSSASSGGAGF